MKCQLTTLVIVCVMNIHLEAFVSYHPIYKCKILQMHDAHTINLSFHVDFRKHDTDTILPTTVALAQACPN